MDIRLWRSWCVDDLMFWRQDGRHVHMPRPRRNVDRRIIRLPQAQCRVTEQADAKDHQAATSIKVAWHANLCPQLLLDMQLRSGEQGADPIGVDDVTNIPPALGAFLARRDGPTLERRLQFWP